MSYNRFRELSNDKIKSGWTNVSSKLSHSNKRSPKNIKQNISNNRSS